MKEIRVSGMLMQLIEPRMKNRMTLTDAELKTAHNRSLYECYNSVSSAKSRTYEAWQMWKTGVNFGAMYDDGKWTIIQFDVESYNTFNYTLSGVAHNSETGLYYYIKITADSQKAYLLIDDEKEVA